MPPDVLFIFAAVLSAIGLFAAALLWGKTHNEAARREQDAAAVGRRPFSQPSAP